MQNQPKAEVWLRGPLPEIPALLQPAAHALLQALEELQAITLPPHLLWEKPSGVASVGFHLQHLAGVLDRLFTYAREEQLSEEQLLYLRSEETSPIENCTYEYLLGLFEKQINSAIEQIKNTDASSLTDVRLVGRAKIPSTHLGLLFHAAEHTQRHVGQLLVTARILNSQLE
ncbi:DinB family protein [Dyadobacter luteus]|jgi:uncharacterized damage-inducible protein DinB|uniref:DinB family protein n=1 Tax=Dyadobacter luteus TaxID=2259619 RepID=A0A3D8YEY1_9BACT|nr:DinB family protein [Dyadobacter luteus]REA63156.1 DinB family protein [Dyadobacter luteus]